MTPELPTDPVERLTGAAEAAEACLVDAKAALSARFSPDGRLDRNALEAGQHVAHGLAWAAA